MKTTNVRFLVVLLISLFSVKASAHDIEVRNADGVTIYYNYFLHYDNTELAVTYRGYSIDSYSNEYSGNVVIPKSVTYNGNTYSVTSIGRYAFDNCSDMTSIIIPGSITTIEYCAFSGCSGLTSVTIPNSVTSIGDWAFNGCSGLTSITIPNSVTSIGESAFFRCISLTSVNISEITAWCNIKFKDYGSNPLCFANSLHLNGEKVKELIIPNSVTNIGNYTFYNCSSLTSIAIPTSVTSIGESALRGCSGLTSINIPNSVTSIGESAFYDCSGLTSITIPNSVNSISRYIFSGCKGLTSVAIPNSVVSIGYGAFYGCSGLTNITIPGSVTSIGESAFEGCRKMSSVFMSNELKLIKANTFKGCTSLSSITIPEKVEVIYQEAFAGCSLTEVKVLATTPPFAYDNTFSNYNIPLYVPEASVSDYQSANPWSKFSSFKTLTGGDVEVKKCATPIISYDNGRIVFSCVTEGVEYSSSITDADIKNYTTSSIQLGTTYTIRVIATKSGYQNSDEATATLSWNGISPIMNGETAKYRLSFIVDNKELSVRNVTYGSQITAPSTDGEGNTVTWYTYPATMPAHDLVVYGMVVKQPEPEVLVWLTVKDGQGTTRMKVRQGTEQVLTITPEEGWKVVSVTLDGMDVTAQVKDGSSYTTPAIMSDATLIVVYEQDAPSDVASARAGQATVKVVDDGVVITHAEPQSRCVVYASNGQPVVSTVIEGDDQKIRLQKGQVYILTINGRTLKFAL